MTIQLFANNAKTTLAAGISSSATTLTVASGTGSLFPTPVAGVSAFKVTLVSASVPTSNEICLCTARSGDTLTIVRAQEGTTAKAFVLNDTVANFDTADVMGALVQSEQLQSNYYTYLTGGGTPNVITATAPSRLTALSDGMVFIIKASGANTGAVTFNLTLGSTATGALAVVKGNNVALTASDIPAAGYPIIVEYNSTLGKYVMVNPGGPAMSGTPTAPTATAGTNTTQVATTAFVNTALLPYAPLASPALTGTPTTPTPSIGLSNTQIATTAFVNPGLLKGTFTSSGYQKFGSGLILQWGYNEVNYSSGVPVYIGYPIPFPTSIIAGVGSLSDNSAGFGPDIAYFFSSNTTNSSFETIFVSEGGYGIIGIRWIALGY